MASQIERAWFLSEAPRRALPLWKRTLHMAALWLGFGAVVGFGIGLPTGGVLPLVSNVLAGMIVLPFLGMFLALLGGRVRPTFAGGTYGALAGSAAGLLSGAGGNFSWANTGLIAGGIAGATLPAMLGAAARLLRADKAPVPAR
jgi:hypothetical protein